MVALSMKLPFALATAFTAIPLVFGGSLSDVKHVVYFMQENRAFDHYFGTMSGVRGFKDPNVHVDEKGTPVWYQPTTNSEAEYLLPFYLGANPAYKNGSQCAVGGSNDWTENHNAWNYGKINGWITNNSQYAWGHYDRSDIPTHFAVAEEWSVADMYAEFVIGPTAPNRASWISGTLNFDSQVGAPEEIGGPYMENWSTHECEYTDGVPFNCYPLKWMTMPELLEAQNISWFVYRDSDSTNDDPMYYFQNYLDSPSDGPLAVKGLSYEGFPLFIEQASNGTLPEVSWIIGSFPLSEHPPHTPTSGAWMIEKTIEVITQGPLANDTVLFISYDETGGWGDHVPPFVSPNGTAYEWALNPLTQKEYWPVGPGFRVPFFAVSPWTRGGSVFSEPSDHSSQLLFLEEWAAAQGKDVKLDAIAPWRRSHMSNLVNMFDFEHPRFDIPTLANVSFPAWSDGAYIATTICQEENKGYTQPPIPYGNQTLQDALWAEEGYKHLRGALTEGRYVVFSQKWKQGTYAIGKYKSSDNIHSLSTASNFSGERYRFIVYQVGDAFSKEFYIQSVFGEYLTHSGRFASTKAKADIFSINYTASKGYTIKSPAGQYLGTSPYGGITWTDQKSYFDVVSVTYNDE
ncbi:phosphoesterase family-domain-containing protein [Lipomyces tetrasporus]|uniref:Phosphoesterase family-domain-containing protein n=1 Tax=Lipomyces tetrasporus TaxID=54092 RepID=A0AAD7QLE9_9ASCO|nr:phosphoesterase family-domain-containing protein [Lipomyces tetrasporus]KAJ8097233.1 phosphoesterase family-domain-containing protein [Lipomyces tetrasporus]